MRHLKQPHPLNQDTFSNSIAVDGEFEVRIYTLLSVQFVYPLPRDEGYEYMFSQFSGHRCHFTSLINYQQYQEHAPVCLTLTHYTDLQESKGSVSYRSEGGRSTAGFVILHEDISLRDTSPQIMKLLVYFFLYRNCFNGWRIGYITTGKTPLVVHVINIVRTLFAHQRSGHLIFRTPYLAHSEIRTPH